MATTLDGSCGRRAARVPGRGEKRERFMIGFRLRVDGNDAPFDVVQWPDVAGIVQWKKEHSGRTLPCKMEFVVHATLPAQAQSIVMSSTTSTEQSGLFSYLLPEFKKASGIDIKVVALGTGQALDTARRGDADVVFVHDQVAEEKFVAEGFGVKRYPVMYNDFVLIGPKGDPVATKGNDIVAALKKISAANGAFISRGDKSGTHAAELRFWNQAGLADKKGSGYKECGCGMGPALNMAASVGGYVLADRGTWLNFKNRADLAVLVEGDN
jgi:tungstate transport system substrate-binding protein